VRQLVVNELIHTEKSYFRDLSLIVEVRERAPFSYVVTAHVTSLTTLSYACVPSRCG
jgi:hypothetical protein